MIVISGATGALGSRIVSALLDRVPAERVGVSVRDPAAAADLAARGVRVRRGDYSDPSTLAAAFKGATRVLVVSANVRGDAAVALNTAALDAARDAGAERVFYTSHQAAAPDSLFPPMRTHAATEQHLAALGIPATALRNGFYADTVPRLVGDALSTGELRAPADGPVSWTTHDDLARAAAALLAAEEPADEPRALLTSTETTDLAGVAEQLSGLSGRPVRRVVVADDRWHADAVAAGMPAPAADGLLGLFRAARRGEFDVTGPLLAELLGRPTTPLRAVLTGFAAD